MTIKHKGQTITVGKTAEKDVLSVLINGQFWDYSKPGENETSLVERAKRFINAA